MKVRALKAGDKIVIVSDEKGVFLGTVQDIEYDLKDDGKKSQDSFTVTLVVVERVVTK